LGQAFPEYGKWLFVVGAASVILFSSPKRNLLKGVSSGLGNFLLNAINNFTDIVSYIRLFAVGLATVAIADAFNQMAAGIGFNSIGTGIMSAFILLFGHLLNIALGPVSIIVHGVRLNVLEFSSHLDVKWSGVAYKPLRS
jgi:V/A-type H+-transporting ATPase subunit I